MVIIIASLNLAVTRFPLALFFSKYMKLRTKNIPDAMLRKIRLKLWEMDTFMFTHTVMVGESIAVVLPPESGINTFKTLPEALEYIKKKRPTFFRRFFIFITPDVHIEVGYVVLPRYCQLF